jgi:hypothetical protein
MNGLSRVLILLLLGVALAGCQLTAIRPGEMQEVTENVERQDARDARVTIEMGAGELNVSGGARDLLEGTFTFNVASWRPEVTYSVTGSTGELRVSQPSMDGTIGLPSGNITNRWDLRFTRDLPLEMTINLGAGENQLNLADLDVRRLTMRTGAGQTTLLVGGALRDLDIQGGVGELEVNLAATSWTTDLTGTIRGGVGSMTLILPADVGVRVEVAQGLGGVNATGLNQDRSVYTNNAYNNSSTTLSLRVESGVGEVTLQGGN